MRELTLSELELVSGGNNSTVTEVDEIVVIGNPGGVTGETGETGGIGATPEIMVTAAAAAAIKEVHIMTFLNA